MGGDVRPDPRADITIVLATEVGSLPCRLSFLPTHRTGKPHNPKNRIAVPQKKY
jgi:hypothetical protein